MTQETELLINVVTALKLRRPQKHPNDYNWELGALESLNWVKAILLPLNPEVEEDGLKEILEELAALDNERKELFENKVKKCIKQYEVLMETYNDFPFFEVEQEVTQLLLNSSYMLELYLQRRPNTWAIGSLDTLRWARVILSPSWPLKLNPEIHPDSEVSQKKREIFRRVKKGWKKRFEDKMKKIVNNDEMTQRMYGHLFDEPKGEE